MPETADTWSAGFSYEPKFLEGLTVEANYFDIKYTNRLESVFIFDAIQIPEFALLVDIPPDLAEIEAIFASGAAGEVTLFDFSFFDAQPEDVQVFIRSGLRNVAKRNVTGLDLNLRYERDTEFGQFTAGLNASYLIDYIGRITELANSAEQLNTLYRPIDLNLRANISWSKSDFTAFLAVNHKGSYRDNIDKSIAKKVDDWTTIDLSLAYDTGERLSKIMFDNTRIGFSLSNLFDEDPPFVMSSDGLNFDPANASPFGRQISVTITKQF